MIQGDVNLMSNPTQALIDFKPRHDFLVCFDSDGCVFDAMEIKHKECFAPNFIKHWNLQPYAKYAREVWEFVNLYSVTRGCNRFFAVIDALELLATRPEAIARGYRAPDLSSLKEWVAHENKLGNPALEKAVAASGDPILAQALRWSNGVNESIADLVKNVPPFLHVRETIEKAGVTADLMVVSATPYEALAREWSEHGLFDFMAVVAGQEVGSKKEQIRLTKNGRYADDHVLMVGDALGDLEAAKANGVLYYPINPGQEDASWQRLFAEGLDRLFSGTFASSFQEQIIAEFKACLPDSPPWETGLN